MNIKEKIAALLAKAKSTDNEHEASAFIAKAEEMLITHQLELGDILDQDDPIRHHTEFKQAAGSHKWNRSLYHVLGVYYGCKGVLVSGFGEDKRGRLTNTVEIRLVGRESALLTVEALYPWVAGEVRRHATQIAESTGMSEQGQAKRVGAALITRIWRLIGEREGRNENEPATAAARNALVTLDQVTAMFDELYPDLRKAKSRAMVSDRMSHNAAASINLSQQVGGSSSTLRIGGR